MPPTKTKHRKKVSQKSKAPTPRLATPVSLAVAAGAGALLGLSAPGFEQGYIAWFGLVPLLLLAVASPSFVQALWRGLVFGTAYNLVYLNWYFHLHPLDWMGFAWWQSILMAAAAWLIVSLHQGVLIALFSGVTRILPLCGGLGVRQVEEKWKVPALFVIPLIWVLIENKLGNAHDLLGVPWSMLEYSQYKLLPMVQITSWIGGIGLGFLIVMVNVALSSLIATVSQRLSFKSLAAFSVGSAVSQLLAVALGVVSVYAFGLSRLSAIADGDTTCLSVLQGNINIDMQKTRHRYTLGELIDHYRKLALKCPPGICIWTESALPAYLKKEQDAQAFLSQLCRQGKEDMVVGSLDCDFDGHPYNSAFGVDSSGNLQEAVYHKRYLVPFGEYTPAFVNYLPHWLQRLTDTPAGTGFNCGKFPVVLDLSGHRIAPLICFETVSPELAAASVRNGGQLLVNVSDLAWFHDSMIGPQMTAFSVIRATENGRCFVFAANTGPSVIIDPAGRVTAACGAGQQAVLTGKVTFSGKLTPFTQWFN